MVSAWARAGCAELLGRCSRWLLAQRCGAGLPRPDPAVCLFKNLRLKILLGFAFMLDVEKKSLK